MIDFKPTNFFRLVKRVSNGAVVEYKLSEDGLDDPKCTIIPVMMTTKRGPNGLNISYLLDRGKIYKSECGVWGMDGTLELRVSLYATPVKPLMCEVLLPQDHRRPVKEDE